MDHGAPPCITVAFAPEGPETEIVMKNVASATGLVYGVDIIAFEDRYSMATFIFENFGLKSVWSAVAFEAVNVTTSYEIWVSGRCMSLLLLIAHRRTRMVFF
jgi:hypothetical protein